MYPVPTSGGTGRERLALGLERLCELLDRHLALMLATDEALHQETGPGQSPDYLHPFIRFLCEGVEDGSLPPIEDVVETADLAFNGVAWPYVHLRGRHEWSAARARTCIVGAVLYGIAGPEPPAGTRRTRPRKEAAR